MKKIKLITIIILLSLLLSGCWDMIEINNRIFPYSIGIDLNQDSEDGKDKYIVTISYPNINAIGKNATQEDRIYIVSSMGDSIIEGVNEISTRLPYKFHFKHLRVLLLGSKLAEDEKAVREVLDGITRDFVINKRVKLIVAQRTAKELLNYKLKAKRQEVVEGALISMFIHGKHTSNYATKSLTDFIEETDYTNASIVPKAKTGEEDIKLYGACIFKDYGCIGEMSEGEIKALSLATGEDEETLIIAPFEDTSITYDISNTKIKKKLIEKEGDFKIQINIETEGKLQEYILSGNKKTPREEFLGGIEKTLKKEIEKEINKVVKKMQEEYKTDILGVGEYIRKFHPKIWKGVEDDWEEVFSQLEIEINLTPKVRRRGLTRIKEVK